jgi:hypothetical protein
LEHPAPHVPQFVVVESDASQPFDTWASQFPNPVLHVMPHTPAVQLGVPPAVLHDCPHAPQSLTVLAVSVSQPLFLLPSQSLKAPVQTGTQAPVTQLVVPCGF